MNFFGSGGKSTQTTQTTTPMGGGGGFDEDREVKKEFESRAALETSSALYPRLTGNMEKLGTGSRRWVGRKSWRTRRFELWQRGEYDRDDVWLGPSLRYFRKKERLGTVLLGAFDEIVESKDNQSRYYCFSLRRREKASLRRDFRLADAEERRRWVLGIRSVVEEFLAVATPAERAALERALLREEEDDEDDDDDTNHDDDDGRDDDDEEVVAQEEQGEKGQQQQQQQRQEEEEDLQGPDKKARPELSDEFLQTHRALRDKRRDRNAANFKARRASENATRETVLSLDPKIAAIAAQGVVLEGIEDALLGLPK